MNRFINNMADDRENGGRLLELMGGAAGYKIDRHDTASGSPDHALVLASSEGHSRLYDLMVGSVVDTLPTGDDDAPEPLRADMVFFETEGGGAVFSVGSIAWSGSLSYNGYDNNVCRITTNVLRRFNDAQPFEMPRQSVVGGDNSVRARARGDF
ncbi:MAG: hypothetical protein RLO02_13970 [Roseitalea porphyridii]|uniref:N,N-dimethylformamidase beta subunit family domain-containing protein n=2 Tax=Roseitalea porphyridii TaxID=1852022 RepID=UPI0032EAF7EB